MPTTKSIDRLCKNPDCNKHVKGHPNKLFCRSRCKDRYHNKIAFESGYRYDQMNNDGAHKPWVRSGVSKETYLYYAEEYGGTPLFNHRGEYVGFAPEPFDNSTDMQNSGD